MISADYKATIYIFEDAEVIRNLLRIHLQQAGYAVRAYADAVEGGKAMLEAPPDLLISDINMPYLDGLDFLAAMKTDPRVARIPTILLTSRTDAETEIAAANAGAVRFLTKPLRKDELLQAVEQALSRALLGS